MTIVLTSGSIYFRNNFSRREDIIVNKYWIGALEMKVVFILRYFFVLFFKQFFGRPFYFSVEHQDLFGINDTNNINTLFANLTLENYKEHAGAKLLIDEYLRVKPDADFEKEIIPWLTKTILNSPYGPAPEPVKNWSYWFIPNNFFGDPIKFLLLFHKGSTHTVDPTTKAIEWSTQSFNNDFPSGHIQAALVTFGVFFIIRRSGKVNFKDWRINWEK